MDHDALPSECTTQTSNFTYWLSIFIIIGTILSNIPFLLKIHKRKSSIGISPYFLVLSVLASICITCNIFCLQRVLFSCCRFQPAGICFSNLLGVITIFSQLIINVTMYFFFIYYYPDTHKYRDGQPYVLRQEWRHTILSLYICGAFSIVVVFISSLLLLIGPETSPSYHSESLGITGWATFLGILSAVFSLVQYAPQLLKTWRTKTIGSLSVPALAIQAPGSFIVCYSIIERPGTNITTWIGMIVSSALQMMLLFLCLYLCYIKRKAKKQSRIIGFSDPLISSSPIITDPIEIELTSPKTDRGLEYMSLHPLYDTSVAPTPSNDSKYNTRNSKDRNHSPKRNYLYN